MTDKGAIHIDPYERMWMVISIVLLVVFAIAVGVAGFFMGIQVPAPEKRVDPQTVATEWADRLEVREISAGRYEVFIIAKTWQFTPNEIIVPVGAEVTFYITSIDYQHGFNLQGTNVNLQIVPGWVSKMTHTFDTAGEFTFICTEYCGAAHAIMSGKVIVTP